MPLLGVGPVLRRRFAANPAVVGRQATINGVSYTIVGVAPRSLGILTSGDLWVPLIIDPPKEMRLNHVFGVSVWDPVTYVAVSGTLALVTLVACAVPALRASRVDPMVALRAD